MLPIKTMQHAKTMWSAESFRSSPQRSGPAACALDKTAKPVADRKLQAIRDRLKWMKKQSLRSLPASGADDRSVKEYKVIVNIDLKLDPDALAVELAEAEAQIPESSI